MVKQRLGRFAAAVAVGGGLAAAGVIGLSGTAGADYGPGAAYQIEISANYHAGSGVGSGIWLWFALTPSTATGLSGTADYHGADCQHHLIPGARPGSTSDAGTASYTVTPVSGTISITGVSLAGGTLTPTVVVSDQYGHYTPTTINTLLTGTFLLGLIFHGNPGQNIQVQVAP